MPDTEQRKFKHYLRRLQRMLPKDLARGLAWLRRPSVMLVRIPVGVLLILGGVFSFLPILGIWMLPLGVLLLAIDVPPFRRAVVRVWPWAEDRWRDFRGRT